MPLVSRTRATLRSAEFGFFGVWVYTRVQTPRFCGQDCSAGTGRLVVRRRPALAHQLIKCRHSLQLLRSSGLASPVELAFRPALSLHTLSASRTAVREATPLKLRRHSTAILRRCRQPRGCTIRSASPSFGSGQHFDGPLGHSAHTSPHQPGNIGFDQVKQTTVAPWSFPHTSPITDVELWNEGTPFRCLGLHTHRKAPAEAQARFSEESCETSAGLSLLQHSQTLQAG